MFPSDNIISVCILLGFNVTLQLHGREEVVAGFGFGRTEWFHRRGGVVRTITSQGIVASDDNDLHIVMVSSSAQGVDSHWSDKLARFVT